MSQPSTLYAWQQTYKTPNNNKPSPQQSRSIVHDTVRKFDMLGRSNNFSSSPPTLYRSTVPISVNDHTNQSTTSSLTSSTASSDSELRMNPHEQQGPQSMVNPKTRIIQLTKSAVPKPTQQKAPPRRRRTPPPIPSTSRSTLTHTTSDNELEDTTNDISGKKAFKAYTKSSTSSKEHLIASSVSSNENRLSKISTHSYRHRVEKPPPPLPPTPRIPFNQFKNDDVNDIGLEINEPIVATRRQGFVDNEYRNDHIQRAPTIIEDYEIDDISDQQRAPFSPTAYRPAMPPPPPAFALPYLRPEQQPQQQIVLDESSPHRSCPLSNFMMELGALLIVFMLCMILVLAIKKDQIKLQTTMLLMFTYVYIVSIVWMIWCTLDIIKFRRQWLELTGPGLNQDEYADITERHAHTMSYFPDIHNTGGLFMRVGAGILCMGGLILTVIELGKTIASLESDDITRAETSTSKSTTVIITKSITYIFRFLFHCVQFTFLFRYGNLIINRYHLFAKIGLIHLVSANLCTWFDAIVFETLEQIHHKPNDTTTTTTTTDISYTTETTNISTSTIDYNVTTDTFLHFIKAISDDADNGVNKNRTTLEILSKIEMSTSTYLYPCLIEYSLISLTVFFIMWRNVGKTDKRPYLRFGARHVFTVNCARASRGLLIGGIIFLLTILTLIPTYILDEADAVSVTHLTELVLLVVSLITVGLSALHTTKLYHDQHAHVDAFDQVLILITTVGDFAYSFFGLFASLFVLDPANKLSTEMELSIRFLAIFQTFFQTGFIMDTLKRRTRTKQQIRNKPGRETITALLLLNLAIWLHDSISAKKVRLNLLQSSYYSWDTWAIIQAFASPLSIFYRFHSSVCLADIWQEVYQDNEKDEKFRLMNNHNGHGNKH